MIFLQSWNPGLRSFMRVYKLQRFAKVETLRKIESGNQPVFLEEDLFAIAMKRINYKEETM